MSVSRLSRDRWRAQVHVPGQGNQDVSKIAPHLYRTSVFPTKAEAKAAVAEAKKLIARRRGGVTVAEWRDRWLNDRLFERPKQSTMIHNARQTRPFTDVYGDRLLTDIDDAIVADWLAGGRRSSQVRALSAMFTDAASPKAGRLVPGNPWKGLDPGSRRRTVEPPSEEKVWELITAARTVAGPFFAGWLQVACFTGMRPGELDALKWRRVDLEERRAVVAEQFSAISRTFTPPKNGLQREIMLAPQAVEVLQRLERRSEFCFVSTLDTHWTDTARWRHWCRTRDEAGYKGTLYEATRHFFGWYATNELRMDAEDLAFQLGHEDGGRLVRAVYGHRDRRRALDRFDAAFDARANVVSIRRDAAAG